jgi:hypothetical protein
MPRQFQTPHLASRHTTPPYSATPMSGADAVRSKAAEGLVRGCGWHGMQGVHGPDLMARFLIVGLAATPVPAAVVGRATWSDVVADTIKGFDLGLDVTIVVP